MHLPPHGTRLEELDTPALVVDAAVLERNIARMAEWSRRTGCAVRPHAKAHKTPLIARKQLDAGAIGICCAKLGEAEAMVAGGVPSVLITSEVVGAAKLRRLTALAPGSSAPSMGWTSTVRWKRPRAGVSSSSTQFAEPADGRMNE